MNVWMSTLRRGITYHHVKPGERKTVCGRFVGEPGQPPTHGYVMTRIEALDVYNAPECKQCSGSAVRVDPLPIGRDGKPASKYRGVSRWGR